MRKVSTFLVAVFLCTMGFGQHPALRGESVVITDQNAALEVYSPAQNVLLENESAATNRPISDPVGTVSSSAVTSIKIGEASNAYTFLVLETNQLSTYPTVGTGGGSLAFLHRQNINQCSPGGSGLYRYTVSTDGGQTWTADASGCFGKGPLNTGPPTGRPARYPNVTLFSRSNSSSTDSLAIAFCGPILFASGSGWDGYVTGVAINAAGTFSPTDVTDEQRHQLGGDQYFTFDMVKQHADSNNFWFLSRNFDAVAGNPLDHLILNKGVWNAGTKTISWSLHEEFIFPFFTDNIDQTRVFPASPNLAFSPDGTVGYVAFVGDLIGAQDSVFSPVFIRSGDGGATWDAPHEFDTGGFPELKQALGADIGIFVSATNDTAIAYSGKATTAFDCELEVDANGNPHLLAVVGCPSLSSAAVAIGFGTPGDEQANYSIRGGRYMLYDFTKDTHGDWNMLYLGEQNTFRGYFGDINSATASDYFTADPYVQVSRTADGNKIFFSVTDTDTTNGKNAPISSGAASTGDQTNHAPDLITIAYDVTTNMTTSLDNRTLNDANWNEQVLIAKAGNPVLENGGNFILPMVVISLDGNSAIDPVSFHYFTDVSYVAGDFSNAGIFFHNCKDNPFANNTSTVDAGCGASDGSATITVSGGIAPYTYEWLDGSGANVGATMTASNLAAGIYTVTVIDSFGCSDMQNVTIANANAPAVAVAAGTLADPSCFGNTNGTATVNATGGTGTLTYTWSTDPGATGNSSTALPSGQTIVTVTDLNNCSGFVVFNLGSPAAIQIIRAQTNVNCNGDADGSAAITSATGGAGNFTYLWSPGGQTTPNISNLGPGNYDVTVKDANNCTTAETFIVVEPAVLNVSVVSSATGSTWSILANGTGGTAPCPNGGTYAYNWTGPNGFTGIGVRISSRPAGQYICTVTDCNGCVASDTIDLVHTGIADELSAGIGSWDLYPNPTSGNVNMDFVLNQRDDVRLTVFDLSGKMVYSQNLAAVSEHHARLDLTQLSKGLYMVKLSTSQGSASRKLMIQ